MATNLKFELVNFKCKRCGCTHYDKLIYTGFKTLDDDNPVIYEKYVCRNCDLPFIINNNNDSNVIQMSSDELLKESKFTDEGVHDITKNK